MEYAKPENAEEKFVQMFAGHERELRGFVRSMGLDWNAVDDVMQMVSLVMWRKWHEFDGGSDFMLWARVITRFEVLKIRRKVARDRHPKTSRLGRSSIYLRKIFIWKLVNQPRGFFRLTIKST